jgi:hypothetical protein
VQLGLLEVVELLRVVENVVLDAGGGGGAVEFVVDPMSPQRMLEKTTCVLGLLARMLDGLPSVLLQGPALPLSSQFMYWLLSFQMLNTSTMPLLRALPMVARPP